MKPPNVLLPADGGEPRLADFGLARDLDDTARLTRTGVLLGTPGFCAPEQMGAGGGVGPATDVYGAGATLYAALTGEAPMRGASPSEVLLATAGRPPERPSALRPGIPRALEALCLRCLEKDPTRRPRDGDALAAALEEWLGLGGGGRGARRRRGRAARRRIVLVVGGASALALAALGVGLGLSRVRAPEVAGGDPAATSSIAQPEDPARREAVRAAAQAALARGWALYKRRELVAARAAAEEALAGAEADTALTVEALALRVHARPAHAQADADSARALTLAPDAPDALVARADHLGRAVDRRPDALAMLDRALALAPRHARGHRVRGTVLLDLGRLEESEAALTRSITLDDADALAWQNRGGVRFMRDDLVRSLEDLSRAIEVVTDPVDLLLNRASTRMCLRDGAAALADLDRAIALRPDHALAFCVRGQVRLEVLQDVAGAIADLRHAQELDPGLSQVHPRLAMALLQAGEWGEALREADATLAADLDDGVALAVRGHALVALGRAADAIEPLERAVQLLSGTPAAEASAAEASAALEQARRDLASPGRPTLGGAHAADLVRRSLEKLADGDLAGARAAADDALAVDPQLPGAWAVRGTIRARQGDRSGAEADVRRALALDPENLVARSSLAELLATSGRVDEARAELEAAARTSPREPGLFLNLGTLHSNAGRSAEAIAAFDRALELLPNLGMAWLRRGEARIKLEDFRGALVDLDMALKLMPEEAAAWHERGVARCGLDEYPAARADFDRALALDSKRAGTLEVRGRVRALALGDPSGGADDLLAAFELDPKITDSRGVVRAFLVAKRPGDALALADRLAKATPDDPLLLAHRADAHARLGDKAAARRDLERALQLFAPTDPNREGARKLLEDLDR